MGRANRRNDYAYVIKAQALRRRAKRLGLPCWICGHPIDFRLDWRDAMAFTADHVNPVALGGSMTGELRPAHRGCNARRGAGRPTKMIPKPVTHRKW